MKKKVPQRSAARSVRGTTSPGEPEAEFLARFNSRSEGALPFDERGHFPMTHAEIADVTSQVVFGEPTTPNA